MTGGLEELDTVEPLDRRTARHNFDRLIMLADGVFAIAVTLSALEIRLPEAGGYGVGALAARLALPVTVYAVSFTVAAAYWVGHRRTMALIARTDATFTALSLAFLACVALIPAVTQVLISAGSNARGALTLYMGLISLLAVVQSALWGYASFVGRLVLPDVTARYRRAHLAATLLTPILVSSLTLIGIYASGPVSWAAWAAIVGLLWARRWLLTRWAAG